MSNPYLGYGRPVFGERFVGRKYELSKLEAHIISSTSSLSVIGQRRIGKTSLITESKNRLLEKLPQHLLYISFDLSTFDNGLKFFNAIMEELEEYLLDSEIGISDKFQRILYKHCGSSYEAYRKCRRGLVLLKQQGVNTKLIIDEFDAVRKFEESDQFIQWLRELIDKGFETGVSIVFLSRRSLFSIEKQIAHVSNLDHVCEKLYLTPLQDEELNILVNRSAEIIIISDEDRRLITEYTGGHPYLAELILCHSCEFGNILQGIKHSIAELFNFYEHLRELLTGDDIFDQFVQIVVGPRWNLKINSASELLNYGLIIKNKDGTYSAWSRHFQDYIEKIARELPIWERWAYTESSIRDMIEERLYVAYGINWTDKLKSRKNNIPEIISNCENIMKNEEKKFGHNVNQRWIDYTYPNDLWQIISREWDQFSPVLQGGNQRKNKKYWAERFEFLSKIRNPLAHNREQVVSDHDMTLANAYCSELCQVINDAQQINPADAKSRAAD